MDRGQYLINRNFLHAKFEVGRSYIGSGRYADSVEWFHVYDDSDVRAGTVIVKGDDDSNTFAFDSSTPWFAPSKDDISRIRVCWDNPAPVYGELAVNKVVVGIDDASQFQVCIAPTGDVGRESGQQCATLANGQTHVFGGLLPGTYRVSESETSGGDWIVGIAPETVEVVAGQRATSTVTNTRNLGRLEVTKVIAGVFAPTDATFPICVRPVDARTAEATCFDGALGHLATAGLWLRPGMYEVYEPELVSDWVASYAPAARVQVALGQTASVTVTNTWVRQLPPPPATTGAVLLTKVVQGTPAAGQELDATFELCLTGPAPATTEVCRMVETIDGTGMAVFTGLVPGTYTVTETDPGDGYTVTISDDSMVVVAGGTDSATITNTIVAVDDEGGEIIPPPVTPPAEEEDSDSGGPVPTPVTPLPQTGIELTLALIATATLGAGVLLLTVARRRTIR